MHDDKSSNLFTLVFVLVFLGSLAVTVNTKLLCGTVSILQSMCVLGYCLGPLSISLPIVKVLHFITGSGASASAGAGHTHSKFGMFMKLVIVGMSLVWSCYAALNFMVSSVASNRKGLAVYPICLFYTVIAWMIVTQ